MKLKTLILEYLEILSSLRAYKIGAMTSPSTRELALRIMEIEKSMERKEDELRQLLANDLAIRSGHSL